MSESRPPKMIFSIKEMRTAAKMVRIKTVRTFKTVEINQKVIAPLRVFIQEKWLNIGKNNELCDVLTCPTSTLPLSLALKPSSP